MEKLKECQSNDGIIIHLLDRIGEYALVSNHTTDGNYFGGFEVHKIKKRIETNTVIGNVKIHFNAKECYRSSSEFGKNAFHYPNLDLVYIDFPQFRQNNDKIIKKLSKIQGH